MHIKLKPTVVTASTLFALMLGMANAPAQESDDPAENAEASYERENHKGKKHRKGKRYHHRRMAEFLLKRVDTNEDGKVDLNEYLTHSEERFNNMDLNSDGYITREEARESHKIMREKFHAKRKEKKKDQTE